MKAPLMVSSTLRVDCCSSLGGRLHKRPFTLKYKCKVCCGHNALLYPADPCLLSLGWLRWHMANAAKVNSSFPSGTFLKTLTPFLRLVSWLLHEKPLILLMYQSVDTNTMMRNPISAFYWSKLESPRELREEHEHFALQQSVHKLWYFAITDI